MFDKSDIRAAVEGGAISDDAAKRLEAFLRARNDPDRGLDSENLRFLSNFNDVFLTIGIAVLMTGLGFLSWIAFSNMLGISKATFVLTPAPLLIGAWLLAEYFCGKRRLLLPSMALSTVIVLSAAALAALTFAPDNAEQTERFGRNFEDMLATIGFAGFGAAAAAAAAIFWRFRLPFSLFLLALTIAGVFYTAVARIGGENLLFSGAVSLGIGIATLVFAIWFDARDPQRASRTSDHAFWLHMAAAPQIIFGLRGLILGSGFAPAGAADAAVMLVVLLGFAFLSLALNRRALIVSGLLTFAATLWVLVDNFGGGGNGLNSLMLTALIVGGSIVLLGGGWRTARRFILKLVPSTGMSGRIFPPEPA